MDCLVSLVKNFQRIKNGFVKWYLHLTFFIVSCWLEFCIKKTSLSFQFLSLFWMCVFCFIIKSDEHKLGQCLFLEAHNVQSNWNNYLVSNILYTYICVMLWFAFNAAKTLNTFRWISHIDWCQLKKEEKHENQKKKCQRHMCCACIFTMMN